MFASMDSSWVMCCDVNFRGDLIAAGGLDNAVSIYKIGRLDATIAIVV
jgi:hypothetical protein